MINVLSRDMGEILSSLRMYHGTNFDEVNIERGIFREFYIGFNGRKYEKIEMMDCYMCEACMKEDKKRIEKDPSSYGIKCPAIHLMKDVSILDKYYLNEDDMLISLKLELCRRDE